MSRPVIFVALGVLVLALLGAALFLEDSDSTATANAESGVQPVGREAKEVGPEVAMEALATERAATESEAPLATEPAASEELAIAPDATGIRGRVIGRDGKPAAGVEVVVKRWVQKSELAKFGVQPDSEQSTGTFQRAAKTDETGRFTIVEMIPANGYSLRVRGDSVLLGRKEGIEAIEKTIVDVGDVAMRRGALLSGVVRSEGGAPIPGAKVSFGWDFDAKDVVANAEGRFQSDVVTPGQLQVRVHAKGFALREPLTREILEGDVLEDFDLELVAAALIRGRVVDEAGRPIPEAYVNANRQEQNNSFGWFGDSTRSLSDGSFLFDSLPPGKYQLSVNLLGYRGESKGDVEAGGEPIDLKLKRVASIDGNVIDAETQLPVVAKRLRMLWLQGGNKGNAQFRPYWRGVEPEIHENGSFRIALNEGGTFKIEATAEGYAPGESPQFDVAQNSSISGIVIKLVKGSAIQVTALDAATRKPVPGARLRVVEFNPPSNPGPNFAMNFAGPGRADGGGSGRGVITRALTDADGRATLRSLFPGKFTLIGQSDGFADARLDSFELKTGVEPVPLELAFTLGGAIEGHVKDDRGRIETALTVVSMMSPGGKRTEAITDDTGHYKIPQLTPGRYSVAAELGEMEGGFDGMAMGFGGSDQEVPLEQRFPLVVEDGQVVTHDLTVTRIEPGSLAGTVSFNGMPMAGLTISVTRFTAPGQNELDWNTSAQAKSDSLGRFKFRSLKPGEYSLSAGRNWERMYTANKVQIASGQESNALVDIPLGSQRVRVVGSDGAPIAGAHVTLNSKTESNDNWWNPGRNGTTDAAGEFLFEEMQAGEYRLNVTRREYRAAVQDPVVIVARRDPGPLTITLAVGGWIVVRVDGFERLGANARLRGTLANGEGKALVSSNMQRGDDGRFWLDLRGNLEGSLKFVARQQNGQSVDISTVPFRGEEGKNSEISITVP